MKTVISKTRFISKPPARVQAMSKKYGILEIPKTGEDKFSPSDISGLELYLDAGQDVSIAGGSVSTWGDQSANSYDATQATAAKPTNPLVILNGNPVIRYDGLTQFLDLPDTLQTKINAATDFTMFFVAVKNSGAAEGTFLFASTESSSDRLALSIQGLSIRFAVYDGAYHSVSSTNISADTYYLITCKFVSATGTASLYVNSVAEVGTTTTGPSPNIDISLGCRNASPFEEFLDGDIAEVLMYSNELSDSDRGLVESYLNSKYNLF